MLLALLLAAAPVERVSAISHHGFFLHADLGLGYYDSSAGTTTFAGLGAGLGLSIGGNIAENVALFGSLFDAVVTRPTISVGSTREIALQATSAVSGFGIGLNY